MLQLRCPLERLMTLLKAIVGLCLGIALFSALQTVGVHSLQDYLKSGGNNGGLQIGNGTPLVTSFDADTFKNGVLPKYAPIDTTEAQRLGVESAARRFDIQ